jgi:hypothetical protein
MFAENAPNNPLQMTTLLGGKITLPRDEIESTMRRSADVEEYVTRSRSIADTVDAHWELAEWCKAHRLTPQREEQLEALLMLEPQNKRAHAGLDHVQYQGEWMTREESMTIQGYVKYKGKWLTRQEVALADKTAAQRQAEQAWFPKVRMWKQWVTGPDRDRQADGMAQIQAIADPDAIPAMQEFLSDVPDLAVRQLYIDRLATMRGSKPVPSLVRTSLLDVDADLRQIAFLSLKQDQRDAAIPYYVDALDDKSNDVINRAAIALKQIGDWRVVPSLIRALVTHHKVQVTVPVQDPVSIANVGGRYSIGGNNAVPLPPNIEIALRAGQLPYGVVIENPRIRYKQVSVRVEVKNQDVLAALKGLTEKDFGYDRDAWQIYWDAYRSGKGKL